jgi:hypothetical protein
MATKRSRKNISDDEEEEKYIPRKQLRKTSIKSDEILIIVKTLFIIIQIIVLKLKMILNK